MATPNYEKFEGSSDDLVTAEDIAKYRSRWVLEPQGYVYYDKTGKRYTGPSARVKAASEGNPYDGA